MIKYALSLSDFGRNLTDRIGEMLLQQNAPLDVEIIARPITREENGSRTCAFAWLERLYKEHAIRPASIHLPFYGELCSWDASHVDEEERKRVCSCLRDLIREYCTNFPAPELTLHASIEPPMEEHPKRLDQIRRTLDELQDLLREFKTHINVEFLPRTCIGNTVKELEEIMRSSDPETVGICFDVNHVMDQYSLLPEMIDTLADRIRTFHISDYDGVDECHWFPPQGIIDWHEVMKAVRRIDHDVTLIMETTIQLIPGGLAKRELDPLFLLRQNQFAIEYLKSC